MRRHLLVLIALVLAAALDTPAWARPQLTAPGSSAADKCRSLAESVEDIGDAAIAAGAPGLLLGVSEPGRADVVRAWGMANAELNLPLTDASVFRIASLTKQFTAGLVMQLVQEGRIRLDDPARMHLPEHVWLGEITINELLIQTSGLPDYAGDPDGEASKASPKTAEDMMAWIGRLAVNPDFGPGERWAYSNSNYVVLGAIVERVTGQSFAQALSDRILGPAGLRDTAVDDPSDLVPHRVSGYSRRDGRLVNAAWLHPSMPGPAGSLRSTVGDLMRWNEALYSGRVLSEVALAQMTAPGRLADGRTTRLGMPQAWQDGLQADYAMGLFVSRSDLGVRVWHSGDIDGFVTWMAHYPQTGVTIVMLQNGDFTDVEHSAVEQAVVAARRCEAV